MYIKLSFKCKSYVIPGAVGGYIVSLEKAPEIFEELPENSKAGVYGDVVETLVAKELVSASYFHACKGISELTLEKALTTLALHYKYNSEEPANYEKTAFLFQGYNPNDNTIIQNLKIAVDAAHSNKDPHFKSLPSEESEESEEKSSYCSIS